MGADRRLLRFPGTALFGILLSLWWAGTAGAGGFDSSYPDGLDLQNRAILNPLTGDDFFRTTDADGLSAGEYGLSLGGTAYRHEMAEVPGAPGNKDLHALITGAWGFNDRLTLGAALPYILRNSEGEESSFLDLMVFGRYRFSGERGQGMRWAGELLLVLPTGPAGTPGNLYSLDTLATRARLIGSLDLGKWDLTGNLGLQLYGETASEKEEWTLLGGGRLSRTLSPRWTLLGEYSFSHHYGDAAHPGTDSILAGARWTVSPRLTLQGGIGTGILRGEETWRIAGNLVYSWGGDMAPAEALSTPATAASGRSAFGQPLAPVGAAPADAGKATTKPLPVVATPLLIPAAAGTVDPALTAIRSAPPAPPAAIQQLRIEVANRSGVPGAGRKLAAFLELQGYPVAFVDDSTLYVRDTTYIYYAEGMTQRAVEVGQRIHKEQEVECSPFPLSEIELLILVGVDLAE